MKDAFGAADCAVDVYVSALQPCIAEIMS